MGRTWTKDMGDENDGMKGKMNDMVDGAKEKMSAAKETVTDKMAGDRQGQSEDGMVEDDATAAMKENDERNATKKKGGEYPSNTGGTPLPPGDETYEEGTESK